MKISRNRESQMELSQQREVQREITIFLKALASYPERFACDPCLSFERHLVSLAAESARGECRAQG
jgi:hypothetical protein